MSENDYLSVASEVFENNVIAIVQPRPLKGGKGKEKELAKAFKTGCAGRITDVGVGAVDGDVSVNIRGICRFDTVAEIPPDGSGIERIVVTYDRYQDDDEDEPLDVEFDRSRLMSALDIYFKNLEIAPDWQEIEKAPIEKLIPALAMACPLHPSEKQSILETVGIKNIYNLLTMFIEMESYNRLNIGRTVN
jgi:Lon protease-like protein